MSTAWVGLIDYGAGNIASVRNALDYLQLNCLEVRGPGQFRRATHLILPGVGAFASAMRRLEEMKVIDELRDQVLIKKKPFLGICVGMQILASLGHEFEKAAGLGFIQGSVEKLDVEGCRLPLPHMGWNELSLLRSSPLFSQMSRTPVFYFVHSYHLLPTERSVIAATCEYGGDMAAAIEMDNIFGVQFHPEKSQHDGLRLLKNFASF